MSLFRKPGGGGFLNNVDVRITGYAFETKEWKSENPKAKNPTYETLTMRLDVLQEGAEEAVPQFLRAGFFYGDNTAVSDDGLTLLTINEDGEQVDLERPAIEEDSEAGRFLSSLLEKGFDEADFGDNGSNFEAIIGRRIRTVKIMDREAQLRIGRSRLAKKLGPVKAKAASEEEALEAGKSENKKDKSKPGFNVDYLSVAEVYEADDWTPPKAKKGTAAKGKATAAVATKPSKASKKNEDEDELGDKAVEVLLAILADAKDSTLQKSQLTAKVVGYAMENDIETEEQTALRKLISSDAFLEREEGWSFAKAEKKQPVTLA